MDNIISNKIPNIFGFLLQVKTIEHCIEYLQEINSNGKSRIKSKKFKIDNKNFLKEDLSLNLELRNEIFDKKISKS